MELVIILGVILSVGVITFGLVLAIEINNDINRRVERDNEY